MTVSIDIPKKAEDVLRSAFGDNLGRAALEAIAMEGYRSDKLSSYEVQTLLGFEDRWQTDAWLAAKGVYMNYRLEDLEADRLTLAKAFPKKN